MTRVAAQVADRLDRTMIDTPSAVSRLASSAYAQSEPAGTSSA